MSKQQEEPQMTQLTTDEKAAIRATPTSRAMQVIARLPRLVTEADDYSWVPLGDALLAVSDPESMQDAYPEGEPAMRLDGLILGTEARRLLGYLWTATGKNHLRPVSDLFTEDDPIVADVQRLALFPPEPE